MSTIAFSRRLSLLAVGITLASTLHAQEASHAVNLPAQPLDQALNALAGQTGARILFATDSAEGLRAPGLTGELSVEQALQRLLLGTRLTVQKTADGSYLVSAPQGDSTALELGATTISGQGMGEATENSGSYTTGQVSIGSKTPTSLRQTPQTVAVVTDQLIQDRRMTDLGEAMNVTPGITVQRANARISQFYSRGFVIENVQIDGAAPMALGTTAGSFYSNKVYDLVEYDHVEVLRGSSGLFGGTGDPGGMINLVRKRPLDTFQLKIDQSAGSWDNYRTQLDVTGPLGFDGKLRGRLVAAYTDRQYSLDNRSAEKPTLYGVLEADLDDATRLTFGGRSESYHEHGVGGGLPRYSDGSDLGLPRNTFYSPKWAYYRGRSQEVFAKLDHDFNDDWKGNLTYTRTYDSGFAKTGFSTGSVDPATGLGLNWSGTNSRWLSEQTLWDANLHGDFRLLGGEHQFLVGMDRQKIDSRWRGTLPQPGANETPIDPFDPSSTPWAYPATNKDYIRDYSPNRQVQYGLYSTLRLQLADPLHLIVGARAQRYRFEQLYRSRDEGVWSAENEVIDKIATKVVPYGGVVYDLTPEWSAYASYSEIFKPQQGQFAGPLPGSAIEPMTGKTYETGIKGELFDGRLNPSAALYYTTRENQAVRDPSYPNTEWIFSGSCCYLTQGKVVSKGLDLQLDGELLPDWMVLAGYTYNHNRSRDTGTRFSSVTPKHLVKLWSTYRLPGGLKDFKVGGGVNLQSANYVSGDATLRNTDGSLHDVPYKFSQAGYAVWNAMAEYQVDEHWTLAYNLNNVFDKKYYMTVGDSTGENWYGEPRNHMLTLRGTFW